MKSLTTSAWLLRGIFFFTLLLVSWRSRTISPDKAVDIAVPQSGGFAVYLADLRDIVPLSTVLCNLQSRGHDVTVFGPAETTSSQEPISLEKCALHQYTGTRRRILDWIVSMQPAIVITVETTLPVSYRDFNSTMIAIPRSDLVYCDWMTALSIQEWRSACRLDSDQPIPLIPLASKIGTAPKSTYPSLL